jgi:glycosyltransferase involved in cell wall biosynthesis
LIGAIQSLPERQIAPVIFISPKDADAWRKFFPDCTMVATSLLDRWTFPWVARKGIQVLLSREFLLERLLRRHQVTLLSHGIGLGPGSRVCTLGWIPDFQHLHLPEFFTQEICRQRDLAFQATCRECDAVLVSSEDARKDLLGFYPLAESKVRVLRFVPQVPPATTLPDRETLEARYGFHGKYFHLPNQFWKHKNHRLVIEALARLRAIDKPALVLATGNSSDYRNPGLFESLMNQVREAGLQDDFRALGVVPYEDILGLMLHSTAVLNPSFFEGWSTTVEEAKCLGVPVLLSDIPVHREQAPLRAIYFNPRDPGTLAEHMATLSERAPGHYLSGPTDAFRAFGEAYQDLVLDLVGEKAADSALVFTQPSRKQVEPK